MSDDLRTAWILLLLARGQPHGYQLQRELQALGLAMSATSVYRRLRHMDHDGWITSTWADSIAGPSRRVYDVTTAGRAELARLACQACALCDAHSAFHEGTPQHTNS